MRVLHLLDSLNRGGAEMLALDVCRNARAHGDSRFELSWRRAAGSWKTTFAARRALHRLARSRRSI
jgi:hypothetical protein